MRSYNRCRFGAYPAAVLLLAALAAGSPSRAAARDNPAAEERESTAAVWDLANLSRSTLSDDTIAALTQHIRVKVFNTMPDYRWLERGRMKEVLDEQKFQTSGCTDQSCAVELGQLLGARKMVTGSVSKTGGTYNLTLSVIDIETGLVDKSASEICPDCTEGELYKLAEKTVLALSGKPSPQYEPEYTRPSPARSQSVKSRSLSDIYAECGLPAMMFPNSPTLASISNFSMTYGITAVTSNISTPASCQGGQWKVAYLINKAYELLETDLASGNGKYLDALAALAVRAPLTQQQFKDALRNDFAQVVAASGYTSKARSAKEEILYGLVYKNS